MTEERLPFKLGYRPALDGVRGVAILLVVPFNFGWWGVTAGYIGVDLFFVLSGFLITSLLIRERHENGRIDFRAFYLRRALRLLPALVFMLALLCLASTLVHDARTARENYLGSLASLFYVANWVLAAERYDLLGSLVHTWSLSVEEQFYLVWPPILALVLASAGRGRVVLVAAAGIAASVTWRIWLWTQGAHPLRIYAGSDTRADALLIGCLLAAALSTRGPLQARLMRTPATVGWGALGALLLGSLYLPSDASTFMQTGGFTAVAIACTALLAHVVATPEGRLARLLSWRPLRAVGRVSYGIYLWHFLLVSFLTAERVPGPDWVRPVVLAVGLAGVTVFSWRFVERPALRLKKRIARPRGALRPPAALGSTADHGETSDRRS